MHTRSPNNLRPFFLCSTPFPISVYSLVPPIFSTKGRRFILNWGNSISSDDRRDKLITMRLTQPNVLWETFYQRGSVRLVFTHYVGRVISKYDASSPSNTIRLIKKYRKKYRTYFDVNRLNF